MSGSLDDLVTAAAAELMAATLKNAPEICQRVLGTLVTHFGVDFGVLRHNDHTIRATVLFAEWPPRENVPHPDPLGVIYFEGADSVFAQLEHLKEPSVLRPEATNADYQDYIEGATGVPQSSLAGVPLLSGDVTTGSLGFVKFGDRDWRPEELRALQAIGTLFAQVQARLVAEEQVRYLAEHDDLTGLLNRRALIAHLDERLAAGQPGPVAVLFLDLDRFKVVNEHLGQNAGDLFIKGFADLVNESAGASSVTARLGGDELVVVPSEPLEMQSAVAFARRLQDQVHQQISIDGEKVTRSASVGVATGVPGTDNTSDLLRRADQATRLAKGAGGAKVAPYSPEMFERDTIRNDIELSLEETTNGHNDALVLHFLPEFGIRTGEILGTEALVRWQHPTHGLLMPDSFIGVLESINLAGKLGRLIMRAACTQFALWRSHGVGRDAVLRVNVSPMELVANNIVNNVAATLDEFEIDPAAVCLEITERVVVQEIDTTRRTLGQLKDIGVQIAIDDFGTGYSALTYLKTLPVDIVKIDRAFVRDLGASSRDQAIVQAIVDLAHALELEVVAEGLETATAARALLDLGCDRAQGFLLSRPVDSTAMESLFAKPVVPLDFATVGD